MPKHSMQHVQDDWRNCSPSWVKQMYDSYPAVDAALAMNEGSQAPNFFSGPLWAIFDSATVERDGWNIKPPFTSLENGYFFSADTHRGAGAEDLRAVTSSSGCRSST